MSSERGEGLLLTSVGKGAGIVCQFREALARCRPAQGWSLWAASSDPFPAGAAFADRRVRTPRADDAEFPEVLLATCRDGGIRVVVPLADHDLRRLAPEVGRFAEAGVRLVCPPPGVVSLCDDKLVFARWAVDAGLPHPRTVSPAEAATLPFPVFAKPRHGSGSAGAAACAHPDDLRAHCVGDAEWIVQERVEGPEFTVDTHVDRRGRLTVCVPRIRGRVVAGQSFESWTVRDPAVSDLARETLARLADLGFHGPANVQVIRGPDPVLIEVNPRLGSATVLSNRATGGALLDHVLADALGMERKADPDAFEEGLTMTRFVGEVFHRDGSIVGRQPS